MSESHTQEYAYRRLGAAIIERAIKDITLPKLLHSGHCMKENRQSMINATIEWFDSPDESIGSYKWCLSLTYVSPNSIRAYVNTIKKERELIGV